MNAREFFHKYRDEHPDLVLTDPGWRTETVLTVMDAYHNYLESQNAAPQPQVEWAADILTNVCQIIDVVKPEWGAAWSDWDQSVRDAISNWLKHYYEVKDGNI